MRNVRLLATAAILAGGLFIMKALEVGTGVADAWAARADTPPTATATDDHAEETQPIIPELNATNSNQVCEVDTDASSTAFAQRIGASPSELEILRSLTQRREALDIRARELDTREQLLQAAEMRVDERITELRSLRDDVDGLLGSLNEREQADLTRIVALYRGMEPDSAAARLAALDEDIQVRIAMHDDMNARTFSAIMAEMAIADAARLTALIAARNELPETREDLEARLEPEG